MLMLSGFLNDSLFLQTLSSVNTMLEKADRTYSEIQSTRSTLERLIMQLAGTSNWWFQSIRESTGAHKLALNRF